MKKDNKPPSGAEREFDEEEEIPDQDFQFVLKQLLSVYQPLLEEELERAKSPERLSSEASKNPITCEEEFEFANSLFEKFFSWVQSPTGVGACDTCAAASSLAGWYVADRVTFELSPIIFTVIGAASARCWERRLAHRLQIANVETLPSSSKSWRLLSSHT
jgi:hypothetical protein